MTSQGLDYIFLLKKMAIFNLFLKLKFSPVEIASACKGDAKL